MSNYSTKITSIGDKVAELEKENRMIVVFDNNVGEDLKDISVMHTIAKLPQEIKVGDYVAFGNRSYKITAVGQNANYTMRTAGHCSFIFNGEDKVRLPQQINVDNKPPLPDLKVGDLFEIIYS